MLVLLLQADLACLMQDGLGEENALGGESDLLGAEPEVDLSEAFAILCCLFYYYDL